MFLPALAGPNKGKYFLLGTSIRCFKGTFEEQKAIFISRAVRPGEHCWDVGAHIGYMSMVMSGAIGPSGTVLSFEPNKANFQIAWQHLTKNCPNARIVSAAIWSQSTLARFTKSTKSLAGQVGKDGDDIVACLSIGEIVSAIKSGNLNLTLPTFLKVDVEGAELEILPELFRQIPTSDAIVICSIDMDESLTMCKALAVEHNASIYLCAKFEHPDPYKTFGDAEVLFVGKDRTVPQDVLDVFLGIGKERVK